MKVAVFSTHILWPSHFETDLEVIDNHLAKKDEVDIYVCNRSLHHCELIFEHAKYAHVDYNTIKNSFCNKCIQKRSTGVKLLENKKYNLIDFIDNNVSIDVPNFNTDYLVSHAAFKKLTYKNYDIGWAILSSFISLTQNPNVNLFDYEKEIRTNYDECIKIYESVCAALNNKTYGCLYVFNGRLSYTKAIFRAAQSCNVDCYVVERGATIHKYSLFKNHTIHNIEKFKENALETWEKNKNIIEKEKIAHQFYANRRKGIIGSWHSLIDLQKEGLLPKCWSNENKNIVFFSSSDDEFASVDDSWKNPYFETQLDAINYIKKIVEQDDRFKSWKLYVRVHPNAQRLGEEYLKQIQALESNNVHIILPQSSISSYALIDECDVVITVGSTVGYEAVYAGKYTIQLGKSLYYNFKGPINPEKKEDIAGFLLNYKIIDTNPNDTLLLGYFMNTFGVGYNFYKPIDYKNGTYKNVNLNFLGTNRKITLKKVLQKLKHYIKQKV